MKLYLALFAALLLTSCNRASQNTEAVRQGVIKHLTAKAGLDLTSMQVDVTSVTFRDNEADAMVSFRPKGSADPANSMAMRYTLERKGGNWVVKGRSQTGAGPHGEASPMGSPAPGGELPKGHPPMPTTPPANPPQK